MTGTRITTAVGFEVRFAYSPHTLPAFGPGAPRLTWEQWAQKEGTP